ncbi:hypothetical protein Ga0466249_005283 [Sporomusaceae bacterium BoRhaA]|uniref:hypothetical protein n=1 Tax=Pelorhabdus rhamnosifermentans TaxID=2772457 RepID=UPI001C0622C7|nr:hypothetical protein [Pelorhabdus rhamnosifermentans]MBU2704129.1 hypothetical protein [Pelorhabdus rhamnosifermentans]
MSRSSLWVMDKNFNGEELKEFSNSWWFAPVAWDILLNKYIPSKPWEEKKHYVTAAMFDDKLFNKLNEKINESDTQEDRILWEAGNQQVFFTKDKEFVAECITRFLTTNSELATDLGGHIYTRFAEVAAEIRQLDEKQYPYFILKNTSCDDNVEFWFDKYNDETEECEPCTLKDWDKFLTEFVVIESDKIVNFISNVDYFGDKAAGEQS